MSRDDPDAFGLFVDWLYSWSKDPPAHIQDRNAGGLSGSCEAIISACLLSDMLLARQFDKFMLGNFIQCVGLAQPRALSDVLETSPQNSGLRRFTLHWIKWSRSSIFSIWDFQPFPLLTEATYGSQTDDPRLYQIAHWYEDCSKVFPPSCSHKLVVVEPRRRPYRPPSARPSPPLPSPHRPPAHKPIPLSVAVCCWALIASFAITDFVLFFLLFIPSVPGVRSTTQTYGFVLGLCILATAIAPPLGPLATFFGFPEAIALAIDYTHCNSYAYDSSDPCKNIVLPLMVFFWLSLLLFPFGIVICYCDAITGKVKFFRITRGSLIRANTVLRKLDLVVG